MQGSWVTLQDFPGLDHLQASLTIFWRKSSQIGRLAIQFLQKVGAPSSFPSVFAPHTLGAPLDIHLPVPCLDKKSHVPTAVLKQIVAGHFARLYSSHLQMFTDDTVHPASKTAIVAFTMDMVRWTLAFMDV